MISIITIFLFLIFLFLSSVHFYWGFGGKWGNGAVIPTKDGTEKVIMPGPVPTFAVGSGLFCIGCIILIKGGLLELSLPYWISKSSLWVVSFIFILRAVGEFNYVGFFKKVKDTKFAENDTRYYSPLCLLIGILTLIIELSR